MRLHRRVIYQALAWAALIIVAPVAFTPSATPQVIHRTIVFEERAYTPFTPAAAETVTVDKWWRELARPVRLKPAIGRFMPGAQGNINPVVPFAHTYLHAPHRLKGRIDRPALVLQGALNPDTYQVGKFTQWWRQLDLPVREWRRIAEQKAISQPPTGVVFIDPNTVQGGPADEPERIACVPYTLRVVYVPEQSRSVPSNQHGKNACHDT